MHSYQRGHAGQPGGGQPNERRLETVYVQQTSRNIQKRAGPE